jgi:tyrosyl-tRNA synthetase
LETALKATSALYDQTAESLIELTAEDISRIFEGAKVCDLLLQPGTTVLDLAVQAGCFTNESKCNDTAYVMLRNS